MEMRDWFFINLILEKFFFAERYNNWDRFKYKMSSRYVEKYRW